MALQGTGIADLITTTLNNVEPMKFTDISTDLQRFIALPNLIKKHKVMFDTGADFRFDLMTNSNQNAKFVGLYNQDTVSVPDVMQQAIVVEKAQQQGSYDLAANLFLLGVAEAADYAIRGSVSLDLLHTFPRAGLIGEIQTFRDDAIATSSRGL